MPTFLTKFLCAINRSSSTADQSAITKVIGDPDLLHGSEISRFYDVWGDVWPSRLITVRRHKQPFILESDVLQMEVVVDSDAFQRRHLHL